MSCSTELDRHEQFEQMGEQFLVLNTSSSLLQEQESVTCSTCGDEKVRGIFRKAFDMLIVWCSGAGHRVKCVDVNRAIL